jgi:carbonic anhydrase/acetyltransferase-like protein (isoleucine patch superfamily)
MPSHTDTPIERHHERYPGAVILPYEGVWPQIAETAFIAPTAVVIGNVIVGEESSIWYNVTVRGDIAPITIGARSNIQDNSVVHVNMDAPVHIGEDVTVGHSAIIHGATVGDGSLIGMGAIVMSYSTLGDHCVVAAGSLVTERTDVESGAVMIGVPAKPRSALDEGAQEQLNGIASRYLQVAASHREAIEGSGA